MNLLRPSEVQTIVGLNRETLRYWRRKLPPLRSKRGNQSCFTLGDALALRVLNRLVTSGHGVCVFSGLATELFQKLNGPEWPRLEHRRLLVCPTKKTVQLLPVSEPIEQVFDEVTFVIDLTADVLTLRNARWGMPDEPTRKSQVSLLTERKRRTSRASSKPN